MEKSDEIEEPIDECELDAFIPFLLDDLIETCLSEFKLPQEQHGSFRDFCSFLAAVGNFQSHQEMDSLDKDYAYFNPDSEMIIPETSESEIKAAEERVVEAFRTVATNANYRKLRKKELEQSFEERSLIKLRTDVDLDEFTQVEFYVRGSDSRIFTEKNWKFQDVDHEVEIWRRVLLLMKFKAEEELSPAQLKRRKKTIIPYIPGKVYMYQYKEVPKPDLEILFPNVQVSMNMKDRILLGVPAAIAAIGTVAKIGVQIILVVGVIIFFFTKQEIPGFDKNKVDDAAKIATTALVILGALGGLMFKQYSKVKNKRIGFLKDVSDQLFFRNIAMNKAVFNRVIDDGEDEDAKEAMLVYYHLLTHKGEPINRDQLDEKIQDWMRERFDVDVDFDIDGPINKLKRFKGMTNNGDRKALIDEDIMGNLSIPSLSEAKQIMDYHWDNAFQYSDSDDVSMFQS